MDPRRRPQDLGSEDLRKNYRNESKLLQKGPKPGDLIEIFHTNYEHWAIYEGNGYVIHLVPTGDERGTGSSSSRPHLRLNAVVKREHLKAVVGNCHYQVNNHLDGTYLPQSVDKILNAAKEKIGEKIEYRIWRNKSECFVICLRYGLACNELFCQEPSPGDLIEIFQANNKHWAIYVQDGHVIHLTPTGDTSGSHLINNVFKEKSAVVKQELLKNVVGNDFYRINNFLDDKYKPQPMNSILRSAEEMVGERTEYSSWEKSEHFVIYLRYKLVYDKQVYGFSRQSDPPPPPPPPYEEAADDTKVTLSEQLTKSSQPQRKMDPRRPQYLESRKNLAGDGAPQRMVNDATSQTDTSCPSNISVKELVKLFDHPEQGGKQGANQMEKSQMGTRTSHLTRGTAQQSRVSDVSSQTKLPHSSLSSSGQPALHLSKPVKSSHKKKTRKSVDQDK